MTSADEVMATARKVVAELPAPFTKEDFLAAYRRSRGKAFPTLKSLNLDVSTFPKLFSYLPDVYDTDFEGEYFYCDPQGPRSRNDLRRELRVLQGKRYQQFKDRVVFIAKGLSQPFKIADLETTFKMKYPEYSSGLPLKKFGFKSAVVLMEQLADRIRTCEGGMFEYFGEDDVEEPAPVPRTLDETEAARIAASATSSPRTATAADATPARPVDGARLHDDVSTTPANAMEQQNHPAAGTRDNSTSPRAQRAVKRELMEVEILEDVAPTSAKRFEGQNAPRARYGDQPAMNETFVIQAAQEGIGRFLQAMMPLAQPPRADKPSAKSEAFGMFIACKLDEAEKEGRDIAQIMRKIHTAFDVQ